MHDQEIVTHEPKQEISEAGCVLRGIAIRPLPRSMPRKTQPLSQRASQVLATRQAFRYTLPQRGMEHDFCTRLVSWSQGMGSIL